MSTGATSSGAGTPIAESGVYRVIHRRNTIRRGCTLISASVGGATITHAAIVIAVTRGTSLSGGGFGRGAIVVRHSCTVTSLTNYGASLAASPTYGAGAPRSSVPGEGAGASVGTGSGNIRFGRGAIVVSYGRTVSADASNGAGVCARAASRGAGAIAAGRPGETATTHIGAGLRQSRATASRIAATGGAGASAGVCTGAAGIRARAIVAQSSIHRIVGIQTIRRRGAFVNTGVRGASVVRTFGTLAVGATGGTSLRGIRFGRGTLIIGHRRAVTSLTNYGASLAASPTYGAGAPRSSVPGEGAGAKVRAVLGRGRFRTSTFIIGCGRAIVSFTSNSAGVSTGAAGIRARAPGTTGIPGIIAGSGTDRTAAGKGRSPTARTGTVAGGDGAISRSCTSVDIITRGLTRIVADGGRGRVGGAAVRGGSTGVHTSISGAGVGSAATVRRVRVVTAALRGRGLRVGAVTICDHGAIGSPARDRTSLNFVCTRAPGATRVPGVAAGAASTGDRLRSGRFGRVVTSTTTRGTGTGYGLSLLLSAACGTSAGVGPTALRPGTGNRILGTSGTRATGTAVVASGTGVTGVTDVAIRRAIATNSGGVGAGT